MGKREAEHIDFDAVMKSLQSEKRGEADPELSPEEKLGSAKKEVSQAARKRASKLSDPRNGYVYSTKERIIHDRTCKRVSGISDDYFEMCKKLVPGMPMCNLCRRKAWIRLGMGDDTKFINAYDRFFREAFVSNDLLQRLFVDNDVKVKILDITHMTFDVNGERWMWERVGKKVVLYHNSYEISDVGTRVMRKSFHKQKETPISAQSAVNRMVNYAWDHSHQSNDAMMAENESRVRKVTVTELRKHFGQYMDLVQDGETVIITKYGKDIAKVIPCQTNQKQKRQREKG